MRKGLFILGIVMLFLIAVPSVLAEANVDVEKLSSGEVVIQNTDKPARFDVQITNNGEEDDFDFYTYAARTMKPEGVIHLKSGETKNFTLEFFGLQDQIQDGNLVFEYFINRESDDSKNKEQMIVKIIYLKDVFEIETKEITPTSETIDITIKNTVNYDFGKLNVEMSSQFFDVKKEFSLEPYGEKNFTVELNKEGYENLLAGFYTVETLVEFDNETTEYETPIKFVEKEMIETSKRSEGFFIDKDIVKKTNEGNVPAGISITTQENIISRLFTTFSEYPDSISREGGKVFFTWNKELEPGKSFEVETKTNWFYPLIIVLLIVGIVYLVKKFTTKDVDLRKKIRFVKTKGGEFGLKVSIIVTSNKYVEDVKLKDKLPALAKIHERFGGERPSNIDNKSKKIEWEFDRLQAGERRMVSYVIYSKIGVLGRFALPPATAFYKKEGEMHESQSNRAYFVAEQAKKESER